MSYTENYMVTYKYVNPSLTPKVHVTLLFKLCVLFVLYEIQTICIIMKTQFRDKLQIVYIVKYIFIYTCLC